MDTTKEEFTLQEQLKIKNEFKRLKDVLYFDSAGSVLYGENQLRDISQSLTQNFYANPHTSKTTENLIDQVRLLVLRFFNVINHDDYAVIFTSNCTAALKIVGESFQFVNNGCFYYLTDSHTSVLGLREIVATDNIIPLTRDFFEGNDIPDTTGNTLFAFSAQCNFNGYKYPLSMIKNLQKKENNYVLLDSASLLSSGNLDLNQHKPDYLVLSFYKIFGYPTGLGALIVSKRGAANLKKKYYGGGTVKIALTRDNWHQKRDGLSDIFEDGTLPFLEIISLQSSFKYFENLLGDNFMDRISRHVFNLGKYFYENLKNMQHYNQKSIAIFYHRENAFAEIAKQGGIVNFNLINSDNSFIGYAEFASIAALHNVILRTGCFCNPGSCQTFLNLSNEDLLKHFKAGHVCGDDNDLVNGLPTGSVRVSFGYMNTKNDADLLLKMIEDSFVQKAAPTVDKKLKNVDKSLKPALKSIRIYPIKSCGAMIINNEWMLSSHGLKYDREWMIVNGDGGTVLTQKNEPKLCLIRPFVDVDKKVLLLEFPYMTSIEIPLDNQQDNQTIASMCRTKVCGDFVNGYDCGDKVADWLSDALNINNLRLIKQNEEIERKSGNIGLSNQAQFLLINEASVEWLMGQVEMWDYKNDVENVIDRFRGNLIIENVEAIAENHWKELKIGEINFRVQGLCTRCQMICIDQGTGEKTVEPLRTIGKVFQGKTKFGIYLKMLSFDSCNQTIKCGDEIVQL